MNYSRNILVSGASFAGLATAFWMKQAGFNVTVVEIAEGLKRGGTPVNIRNKTVDIVKRMGLFDQIQSSRLNMQETEFIGADDVAERPSRGQNDGEQPAKEDFEIERDVLLNLMFNAVKEGVEFIFGDSIASLRQENNGIDVSFRKGSRRSFDLIFGCDGVRSDVRKLWFGAEEEFSHFLGAYGSVTIVDKLLIPENTSQMYNEPGKMALLSAYNNKTDIILIFSSEQEIPYDYRDKEQKRNILMSRFSGVGWRTQELLKEVEQSKNFYFDKLSQIKMPSWTKGRVALVGDAGYCASPAAGMGGSLAIDGAAALADAFRKWDGNFELAFQEYNESFRPFIEECQADAVRFGLEFLVPKTAEAIRARNAQAEDALPNWEACSLKLPEGLRLAGRNVPAADGRQVPLYLFRLPDGSDMEMVAVPAGDFVMGADDSDAMDWEKPKHTHPMEHSYWIGRNDVTRRQFKALCTATGRAEPENAYFDDTLGEDKDRHPVIVVSWEDAKAYCAWAGLVLPTEAEWEKAARGTDGRKYPWGNAWDPGKANFLDASCPGDTIMMGGETLDEHMAPFGGRDKANSDGFPYTSPVGSFPTGASPCGALDMAGNVFNWCEDWWDETGYPRSARGDFSPPQCGAWRVDRGSSWGNPGRSACRCSMRYGYPPSDRNEHLGFRVLLRSVR